MKKAMSIFLFLFALSFSNAQSEFADVVLDAYYSGAFIEFNTFYGNNGTTDGCKLFETTPAVALGDTDIVIALPTGSYITLGFTDNLIFDATGQDDLFIEENGGGQEFGELYVSPDGVNFTFLDTINGADLNSYDLSDYVYDDVVKAVKIVGLDQGGCVPGLDIARVYGIAGANCPCGADLADFPEDICALDTLFVLDNLVLDSISGIWKGPGVYDDVNFNPDGLEQEIELSYLVNVGHPVCPVDTIAYPIKLAYCDCNLIVNGLAVIDQCDLCLEPSDPRFNISCIDCADVPFGASIVDSCGLCLDVSDPFFNSSCMDCNGLPNGPAIMDLCGQCLLPEDPLFNTLCPELFQVYLPNIFNPNIAGANSRFGLLSAPTNIGLVKYFEVYDSWGNRIFSIYNQELKEVTQWWDGRRDGIKVMTGIYTYRYHVSYPEIEDDSAIGTVLLLR